MTYGNETAYFPNSYNYVNEVEVNENTQALIDVFKTLTDMVNEADQITTTWMPVTKRMPKQKLT